MALPHRSTPHDRQKSKRAVDFDLVLKLLAGTTLFGLSGFIGFLAGGLGTVMQVKPVSDFMHKTTLAIVAAWRMHSTHRTGAVSCSASSRLASAEERTGPAEALATTGTRGSPNVAPASACDNPATAGCIKGE